MREGRGEGGRTSLLLLKVWFTATGSTPHLWQMSGVNCLVNRERALRSLQPSTAFHNPEKALARFFAWNLGERQPCTYIDPASAPTLRSGARTCASLASPLKRVSRSVAQGRPTWSAIVHTWHPSRTLGTTRSTYLRRGRSLRLSTSRAHVNR